MCVLISIDRAFLTVIEDRAHPIPCFRSDVPEPRLVLLLIQKRVDKERAAVSCSTGSSSLNQTLTPMAI
jgi:hypothetical protein